MTTRKKPSHVTEAEVLTRSRRRCCICFGLSRDVEVKTGQIAHLDGDNSNSSLDNLAFLCFEHHDKYDSKTSQSKNFTLHEVKRYRDELYENVLPVIEAKSNRPPTITQRVTKGGKASFEDHRSQELKNIIVELLPDMSGPLRIISSISHDLSVSVETAQRLLFELAEDGVVRIDRRRGSARKTYSLAASRENRLIDTFATRLGEEVVSDERYLRHKIIEMDALIKTSSGTTYAVETMFARDQLLKSAIERRIKQLTQAKKDFGVEDATSVILVGITTATRPTEDDLKSLEIKGLKIKYVDLE